MSGGAFDYNCFKISQFAEELKNKIDENDVENEYGYAFRYSEETIEKLLHCQRVIELAGKLAHEIEWLYSGDIGEDTFLKRIENLS
jgi:hypothetical protein